MTDLPRGTVTMLFTDIEESTRLVRVLGDGYEAVLSEQRDLLRAAVAGAGGHEVECRADELFACFERAGDAVAAAIAAQRSLQAHAWPEGNPVRVRMGLHTGEPQVTGDTYLGLDVHVAARVSAAAHGSQILVSKTTRDLVRQTVQLEDLGEHVLSGMPEPERLFQVTAPDLPARFPPLRAPAAQPPRERRWRPSRPAAPSLADAGWTGRALVPPAVDDPALQRALAELGASLFTADRALRRADGLLARVDRDHIVERRTAQRELATHSQRARAAAVRLDDQVAAVDALATRRDALANLAAGAAARLDASLDCARAEALRGEVAAAAAGTDECVEAVARTLDSLSFRLERTRRKGVYREGRRYVVPYYDGLAVERRREFETLGEASDFRHALTLAEKAQSARVRSPLDGEITTPVWGPARDSQRRP